MATRFSPQYIRHHRNNLLNQGKDEEIVDNDLALKYGKAEYQDATVNISNEEKPKSLWDWWQPLNHMVEDLNLPPVINRYSINHARDIVNDILQRKVRTFININQVDVEEVRQALCYPLSIWQNNQEIYDYEVTIYYNLETRRIEGAISIREIRESPNRVEVLTFTIINNPAF